MYVVPPPEDFRGEKLLSLGDQRTRTLPSWRSMPFDLRSPPGERMVFFMSVLLYFCSGSFFSLATDRTSNPALLADLAGTAGLCCEAGCAGCFGAADAGLVGASGAEFCRGAGAGCTGAVAGGGVTGFCGATGLCGISGATVCFGASGLTGGIGAVDRCVAAGVTGFCGAPALCRCA